MPLPRLTRLTLRTTTTTDTGATLFDFKPDRPLHRRPGQHALWRIPGGGLAPFTIASAPTDDALTLATVLGSAHRTKTALAALRPGDQVSLFGPLGGFPHPVEHTDRVLLAQGIGITPFTSLLRATGGPTGPDTTLVQVGPGHLFTHTVPLAGHAVHARDRHHFTDVVTELAQAHPYAQFVVSGTPDFVSTTHTLLRDHHIPRHLLHSDRLWGMRTPAPAPTPTAAG